MESDLATPDQIAAHRKQQRAWEAATQSIRDEIDELAKTEFDSKQVYTVRQFPDDIQTIYHKVESAKSAYEKQLSYLVERQAQRAATRFDYVKELKAKPEKVKRYRELEAELKKFGSLKPTPLPVALVATDIGPKPAPTFLLTRTTKETVEPTFLALLGMDVPAIKPTGTTTGRRTALANWIARDDNPLSTRVIVNRIWQRHFGRGIVPTPNDFGTLGDPPSHPELLDWLTCRFLEGGWRTKPLHALIMNSAAYRQTARREPTAKENDVDPTNRLLWRFSPQRLDAEQVRDAMLAVSGELKQRDGGASVKGESPFRSIYVIKKRNKPDEMLSGFDAPLGFESAPDRIATTTPIQSLLLVNGSWSLERSRSFAKRLLAGKKQLASSDIRTAYQLIFGREATDTEVGEALAFVRDQADTITAPLAVDNFPNETGLRPITQYFGAVKQIELGRKSLWIQPGSRFERLHAQKADGLDGQFTVEAIANLDRLYPDASVNTLISRWSGNSQTNGWGLGVTSEKSALNPRNFIVQLVGRTFQDEPAYEVVASGLRFPLGKPVYLAAVISASTSADNPTGGTVTFYLKDLSDPKAKLETATVETSVVDRIQNPALKIIAGGRDARGHQWDGQLARLTLSRGALPREQLLIGNDFGKAHRILDWTFSDIDGNDTASGPTSDTAWLRRQPPKQNSNASNDMLGAVTDLCHALFNSNEFLYLH